MVEEDLYAIKITELASIMQRYYNKHKNGLLFPATSCIDTAVTIFDRVQTLLEGAYD